MTIFNIENDGQEHVIKGSCQRDKIVTSNKEGGWYTWQDNNSLYVQHGTDGTTIILKDWLKQSPSTVMNNINGQPIYDFDNPNENRMSISWDDGTPIEGTFVNEELLGTDKNDVIYAKGGFDYIEGKTGNDKAYFNSYDRGSYVFFNAGDGVDKIYNATEKDALVFKNVNIKDLIFTRVGNDMVVKIDNSPKDSVTLVNYFISKSKLKDIYYAETTNISEPVTDNNPENYQSTKIPFLTYEGTGFNDRISVGNNGLDAEIHTGTGDDIITLSGNDQKSVYIVDGSGIDTVSGIKNTDKLIFDGVAFEDLEFSRSGYNLKITHETKDYIPGVQGARSCLTLTNYFKQDIKIALNEIETIINEKDAEGWETGNVIRETHNFWEEVEFKISGKGTIKDTFLSEEITDSRGNDTIYSTKGDKDVIILTGGKDTIIGVNCQDKLVFKTLSPEDGETFIDVDFENLYFEKVGNDFKITNGYDGSIATLKNYFGQKSEDALFMINGTDIVERQILVEQYGKGKIYGSQYDDIIFGSNKNDTIYASTGSDDIDAGAGNDIIHTSTGGSVVYGGAGNDRIYVNPVTETVFDEETGVETPLENVIVFEKGSGNDTIYGGASTDFLQVWGYAKEDITFTRNGNNLVIKGTYNQPVKDKMVTKSDSMTLVNWFIAEDKIDKIAFSDDNLFTYGTGDSYIQVNGTAKNDTLNAIGNANLEINTGKGSDTVRIGGSGTKILNCVVGNGNSTITIDNSFSGNLYLNFEDDKVYELSYGKSGNDLVISQNSNPAGAIYDPSKVQTCTIKDFYASGVLEGQIRFNYFNYEFSEYRTNIGFDLFKTYENQAYFAKGDDTVIISDEYDNVAADIFIYGSNKDDEIDTRGVAGRGVTIMTGQKGETEIETGGYEDTVVVSNFSGTKTYIADAVSDDDYPEIGNTSSTDNDSLKIYGLKKGDGVTVFFDVDKDYDDFNTMKDVIFVTSSGAKNFVSKKGNLPSGVMIQNWLNNSEDSDFENVSIMGAEANVEEHINIIAERVRDWLNDSTKNKGNHQTAWDVLTKGSTAERNSLLSVYTSQNLNVSITDEGTTYNGSNGNDVIYVGEEVTVNGGKGNDILRSLEDTYDQVLNGGDGNDVLVSSNYSTMNGGKGTNVLSIAGHEYSTTYVKQGGGSDYVHYTAVDADTLSFKRDGDDLLIESEGFETYVVDYFKNPAKSSVKGIAFSDAEVDYEKTGAEIVNAVKAESRSLTELFKEKGIDIWAPYDTDSGVLKGSDIAGVVDTFEVSEWSNDSYYGYRGENRMYFKETSGTDTVYSGKGQDYLYFNSRFPEEPLSLSDFRLTRSGNNLIIRYTDNDSVTIANYYKLKGKTSIQAVFVNGDEYTLKELLEYCFCENETMTVKDTNEYLENTLLGNDTIKGTSADNALYGGEGDDIIYTGAGNDTIVGGKGDDKFYGQGGTNTYVFNLETKVLTVEDEGGISEYEESYGDGNDTIYAGKKDTTILDFTNTGVEFSTEGIVYYYGDGEDVYAQSSSAYYKRGNDLLIKYSPDSNSNCSVTISGFFISKTDFILRQSAGEDINLRDVVVYIEADKNSKVNGSSHNDIIYLNDDTNVNYTVSAGAGDDVIETDGASCTIKCGSGNDKVNVQGNTCKIYCESGNNIIYMSEYYVGTTTIYSGKGNDTIDFRDYYYEEDSLYDGGFTLEDLTFSKSGNNLVIVAPIDIDGTKGENKIILSDYFKGNHSVKELIINSAESLNLLEADALLGPTFANPMKKASITGTVLRDVIHGTVFNDTLNGAGADDTLYGYEGNDSLNGGVGNDLIYGGRGNDTIKAGASDAFIPDSYEEPTGDIIYGGEGNDKIYGEGGYNKICFSNGDGNDTIYMGNGYDEIFFDETVSKSTVSFKGSGNNLIISYGDFNENGMQSSITVVNYFSAKYKSLKTINFETEFTKETINLEECIPQGVKRNDGAGWYNAYDGTMDSNFIYLNSSSKKVVDAAFGSSNYSGDWVNYNDNDIIQSNSKWAYLEGAYGDDTYIVNSLSNVTEISDVDGTDTIILNESKYNNKGKSQINILFNVFKKGLDTSSLDFGEDDIMYHSLFIMNNASKDKMIRSKLQAEAPNLSIYDYFNERGEGGAIESIQTKDGEVVTSSDLFAVKEAIASWLANKDGRQYNSAIEVLMGNDKTDIDTLFKFYEATWDTSQLDSLPQYP